MRLALEGGAEWSGVAPEDFWEAAARFFDERGWGSLTFRDLHPALGALELADWVEAEAGGGPRGCHLSTGLFTALVFVFLYVFPSIGQGIGSGGGGPQGAGESAFATVLVAGVVGGTARRAR